MKHRVGLTLLLAFAASTHTGIGQTGGSDTTKSDGPTLKDTASWLEAHLVGLKQSMESMSIFFDMKKRPPKETGRHTAVLSHVVLAARFVGCVLNVEEQNRVEGGSVGFTTITVTSVPLDRMWNAQMKEQLMPATNEGSHTVTWNPDHYIVMRLEGPSGAVSWKSKVTSVPPDPENDASDAGSGDSFSLQTDDGEIAPRLVKALNHAIELCSTSAKPEPF